MFVLIASGGRTGAQLASSLIEMDHEVRVVENRAEVLSRIHRELPTEVIVEGDLMDLKVLELAIRDADVMAATTTSGRSQPDLCHVSRHYLTCGGRSPALTIRAMPGCSMINSTWMWRLIRRKF
jgi:trk system potassium uptake protein TrkA